METKEYKENCFECQCKLNKKNLDKNMITEFDGVKNLHRHYYCRDCADGVRELFFKDEENGD